MFDNVLRFAAGAVAAPAEGDVVIGACGGQVDHHAARARVAAEMGGAGERAGQADHPGFRRLCLQALAFRTIPGNGDFNRHRRFVLIG